MGFLLMNVHIWSPIKGVGTEWTFIQFIGSMRCNVLLKRWEKNEKKKTENAKEWIWAENYSVWLRRLHLPVANLAFVCLIFVHDFYVPVKKKKKKTSVKKYFSNAENGKVALKTLDSDIYLVKAIWFGVCLPQCGQFWGVLSWLNLMWWRKVGSLRYSRLHIWHWNFSSVSLALWMYLLWELTV